jgi:hypothetical protein
VLTAELRVRHTEIENGACVTIEETFPVACDDVIAIERSAPACPGRPRSPRPPSTPGSGGPVVLQGEEFTLVVIGTDACGNVSTPCMATPAKAPPRGEDWVHEILFEGVRIEAQSEPNRLALYDQNGNAMTKRLPRIADAVRRLPVNRIILDGMVIVQDRDGRSDPAALVRDLAERRQDRLVYYAFDLLHLDGFNITDAPLLERKRVLESLLAEAGEGPVAYSAHLDINGREMPPRQGDGLSARIEAGQCRSGDQTDRSETPVKAEQHQPPEGRRRPGRPAAAPQRRPGQR